MRKRTRTRTTGLMFHATPNGHAVKSQTSLALAAFEKGEATKEDLLIVAALVKVLKDKRLSAPTRIKRGIPQQTVKVCGDVFTLTKEDLEEFKAYKERIERIHNDKSLELLICD